MPPLGVSNAFDRLPPRPVSDRTPKFTGRIDQSSSPFSYIGRAVQASSEANPVWQIGRIEYSSASMTVLWADGNQRFDNVWANRASLSYS